MSDIVDVIPIGGINTDVSYKRMPKGISKYKLNCIIDEDGESGTLTNIKGNEKILTLSISQDKVLGYVYDEKNSAGIYAVYDASGNHSIVRYNSNTDDHTMILNQQSVLNFHEDYPVDMNIINVNDVQLLYFNDNYNKPRKINIQKAINFTAGSGSPAYTSLTSDIISVVKKPPLEIDDATHGTDTNFKDNLIGNKLFKFAYQYIYDDGEISVLSNSSNVSLPKSRNTNAFSESDFFTVDMYDVTLNNRITFTLDKGSEIVEQIYLYVKEGDFGDWFLYDIIDSTGTGTFTYNFYNNKSKTGADQSDLLRSYDYTPLKARTQELLNGNRLAYGGINEGFNEENIDISIDVTARKDYSTIFNSADYVLTPSGGVYAEFDVLVLDAYLKNEGSVSLSLKTRSSKTPYVVRSTYTLVTTPTAIAADLSSKITIETPYDDDLIGAVNIGPVIRLEFSSNDARNYAVASSFISDQTSGANISSVGFSVNLLSGGYGIIYTLDTNFNDPIDVSGVLQLKFEDDVAVEYYVYVVVKEGEALDDFAERLSLSLDATIKKNITTSTELDTVSNRYSTVYTDGTGTVWVQVHSNTISAPSFSGFYNFNEYFEPSITLKPGSNQSYGIVYYNEDMQKGGVNIGTGSEFQVPNLQNNGVGLNYNIGTVFTSQITIAHQAPVWAKYYRIAVAKNLSYTSFFTFAFTGITVVDGKWEIDINSTISTSTSSLQKLYQNNANLGTYTFNKGDKIKFLGFIKTATSEIINTLETPIEVDIIGVNGTKIVVQPPDVDGGATSEIFDNITYYEIYTPTQSIDAEDVLYYELPDLYNITNRNHLGKFGDTSQNYATTDAVINVNYGDCFVSPINFVGDTSYVTYQEFPYVFGGNTAINIGVPNISADTKNQTINAIRYGGEAIDGTAINNISTFLVNDIVYVNNRHGNINYMKQVGFTLKVYQESKVTSYYLGREQALDANGNSVMSYSSNVIGTGNPAIEDYGTIHKLSCVKNDRSLYFFDFNSANVIRDSANGMIDISQAYGIQSYIEQKVNDMKSLAKYNIVAGFDDDNGIYFLSFIDLDDGALSETVGFHEPTNQWISFYTFVPELYGNIGEQKFLSFKNGDIYLQNSDDVNRCTFYGQKYMQEVEVVSNEMPNKVKIYDYIEIDSNKKWSAPDNDSIKLPANLTYPNGMQSRLKEGQFKVQEGKLRAYFLRDMLTANGTPNAFYLHTGRLLRGDYITVRLENSHNEKTILSSVEIGSTLSR